MVRKQLVKTGLIKSKLNKYSIEILRNIEILCFIKKASIKKLQDIILNKIKTNIRLKPFCSYLTNYLFKLDYKTYNYEDYLKYFDDNNDNNKYMDKIYFTNNVIESLNAKINSYLPKKIPYNNEFINCITKIFININTIGDKIIRHDYVSKTLIKLISDLNISNSPRWITYDEYIKVNKTVTKTLSENLDDNNLEKLMSDINDLNIEDEHNNNEKNSESEKSEENMRLNNVEKEETESNIDSYSNSFLDSNEEISDNIENNDGIKILMDEIESKENKINEEKEEGKIIDSRNDYFQIPLHTRIKTKVDRRKKKDIKSEINIENKPKKRKYDYPKDEVSDNINKRKNKVSCEKQKKKGWK